MTAFSPKPFPIPVVAGPGSQDSGDAPDYLSMPSGMATYQPPRLPEPEEMIGHQGAVAVLEQVLSALRQVVAGGAAQPVSLMGLPAADRALVGQVLGEGEVSAQVLAAPGAPGLAAVEAAVQIQESVFAGVWRVLEPAAAAPWRDRVELGAVPSVLLQAAREDGALSRPVGPLPPEFHNAQAVLVELADQRQHWRTGQPAEIVNLTLLPLSPEDIGAIDQQIGTGRVLILSRGYGNCRISNAQVPHTWRVVYYNSQDTVILNSVEVCAVPEVACAAPEDLVDSAERLVEVLAWVTQPEGAA
jgi:hydrogenase-1 operon protein HyaF